VSYQWRKMTERQRNVVLDYRRQRQYPWHGPQHRKDDITILYHITAACYDHAPIIGATPQRLDAFSDLLIREVMEPNCKRVECWCVLPNHYHVLVACEEIHGLIRALGLMHGRLSRQWNKEDGLTGKRQCWHRCVERSMRSDRHEWATLNYVHHNPVHHGYVKKWDQWPWSSARDYLRQVSRKEAERRWKEFPVLDYGAGWDDADR